MAEKASYSWALHFCVPGLMNLITEIKLIVFLENVTRTNQKGLNSLDCVTQRSEIHTHSNDFRGPSPNFAFFFSFSSNLLEIFIQHVILN